MTRCTSCDLECLTFIFKIRDEKSLQLNKFWKMKVWCVVGHQTTIQNNKRDGHQIELIIQSCRQKLASIWLLLICFTAVFSVDHHKLAPPTEKFSKIRSRLQSFFLDCFLSRWLNLIYSPFCVSSPSWGQIVILGQIIILRRTPVFSWANSWVALNNTSLAFDLEIVHTIQT